MADDLSFDITVKVDNSVSGNPAVTVGNRATQYGDRVTFKSFSPGSYPVYAEEIVPPDTRTKASDTAKVDDKSVEITLHLRE